MEPKKEQKRNSREASTSQRPRRCDTSTHGQPIPDYPGGMALTTVPRIVLAVGLPGSGKSTWFATHGIRPLSSDALRALLLDDEANQGNQRAVFAALRWMVRKRLELRRPVTYIDATHLTLWERQPYLRLASLWDCSVEALWFDEPYEVCLARNRSRNRVVPEQAMQRMRDRLVAPTLQEGFSAITIIREGSIQRLPPEALDVYPEAEWQDKG